MATPRKSARTKQIPQRSKEDFFDPKMEFDAPMFHNFGEKSPASTRQDEKMDEWFEMRLDQIYRLQFVEPVYSPLTAKNVLAHSVDSGTLTSRKAKKAVALAADVETMPKLILEEEDSDLGASVTPTKQTPVSAAASKAGSSEFPVSQQAVQLAPLPGLQPFVPAPPVPVASVLPAKPDEKAEGKAAEPQSVVAAPTHRRRRWVKPEMPALRPRVWSVAKAEPTSSTSASSVTSQQTPVASRVLASKTPVASKALTSQTPVASSVLASSAASVSNALSAQTPVTQPVAAKKPLAPVSPRCYRITRSQIPPAKRSHSEPPQSQLTKRTVTRPQEFSFMSRAQASKKPKSDTPGRKEDEKPPEFVSLLRPDTTRASRQPHGVTKPVEFHFATTTRARTHATQHSAEAPSAAPKVPVEKARPPVRGVTQPKEFSFATSSRLRAPPLPSVPQVNPRPCYSPLKKPSVAGKHITVPQAFNLSKSNRPKQETAPPDGAGAAPSKREPTVPLTSQLATRKRKVPEKLPAMEPPPLTALENGMGKFKTNVPHSLKRPPFRPLTSNRPVAVADTPGLKTTARAQRKAEFSVEKNQRLILKERREVQAKPIKEENEREEVQKLRKSGRTP